MSKKKRTKTSTDAVDQVDAKLDVTETPSEEMDTPPVDKPIVPADDVPEETPDEPEIESPVVSVQTPDTEVVAQPDDSVQAVASESPVQEAGEATGSESLDETESEGTPGDLVEEPVVLDTPEAPEKPLEPVEESIQPDTQEPAPTVVETPTATADKVLIDKPIAQWTLDEVKAFVRGEARKPASISDRDVVERGQQFAYLVSSDHAAWGFRDVFTWLKHDEVPQPVAPGLYASDPRRANKHANEWTREELVAFLRGQIKATLKAPEEELMDAVIEEWKVPAEWTDDDIKQYVLKNRQPQKTERGFWLNDRVRDKKPAQYWTNAELLAFVREEISATPAADAKQLFAEIRTRFQITESYSSERLQQLLTDYKEEPIPMSLQFVQHNLDQYAAGMGTGVAVTNESAAGFQTLLYHTMNRVLRLEGRDFVDGWTKILDFINTHRTTMFDERRSFRGINVINLSDRDRKNLEQLLNLAIKTSAPATRYDQANNTNFQVALRGITDETVRQRVLSYYQITN